MEITINKKRSFQMSLLGPSNFYVSIGGPEMVQLGFQTLEIGSQMLSHVGGTCHTIQL